MKKVILIILLGILLGSGFAYYMFSNIEENVAAVISDNNTAIAFQVGVFSVYENANNASKNYDSSFIYQENSNYRVFIAIYQDQEIINLLKEYYAEKNINVYLKQINVNDSFQKDLGKYEKLLKESGYLDTYLSANKNILKAFGESL